MALKYDPKKIAALVGRGDMYRQLGVLPKAITDATDALKLDPKNATALANRAYALVRSNKDADAIKDADEAIKLDAKQVQAYLARGIAKMKSDKAAATADVKKALELDPKSTIAQSVLKQLGG